MRLRYQRLCVIISMTLLLIGCDAAAQVVANNDSNTASSESTIAPQEPQRSQRRAENTPDATVENFLAAWNAQNIEEMYSYLSPRSQEIYDFNDFRAKYSVVQSAMAFAGVSYTIGEVQTQGQSAAVTYDVTLQSQTFGDITDEDRTMRLLQSGNGWQVAWLPGDILTGYATDVRIQPDRSFPQRANIYDRDGQPLVDEDGLMVYVRVREQDMNDIDACIRILAEAMLRAESELVDSFNENNSDTLFYIGEMDQATYNTYRPQMDEQCGTDIPVPELGNAQKVITTRGRNYYGHGATTHVTGYIGRVPQDQLTLWESRGYAATDIIGRAGIELTYQDTLAGRPEQFLRLIDPAGTVIRELGSADGEPPTSVTLTIDRDLQYATAQALNDAFNYAAINWASRASGGAAVVMDVETGGILAMASYPTFDPRVFDPDSTYGQSDRLTEILNNPRSPLTNKAVQEQYFPGSTFKIVTTVAAADTETWLPGQPFDCALRWYGQEEYGDALPVREDWRVVFEEDPAGEISMSEALTASCNPFYFEMGARLFQQDNQLLAQYANLLGFGEPTGIGSALSVNEASGTIPTPNDVTELINNAVGQGNLNSTAIQMARMVAGIANGGNLFQPQLIQQIGGTDGQPARDRLTPQVVRDLTSTLTPQVFEVVKEGMCAVPNTELGTGYFVFGDGADAGAATYTSCGKTGSAQAGPPESNIPPNSWYVAYAPRENPEIAIAVVVPTSREGSDVAAPITRRILDNYFNAPIAPYPEWWEGEYDPVPVPQGLAGLEAEQASESNDE